MSLLLVEEVTKLRTSIQKWDFSSIYSSPHSARSVSVPSGLNRRNSSPQFCCIPGSFLFGCVRPHFLSYSCCIDTTNHLRVPDMTGKAFTSLTVSIQQRSTMNIIQRYHRLRTHVRSIPRRIQPTECHGNRCHRLHIYRRMFFRCCGRWMVRPRASCIPIIFYTHELITVA